MSADWPFQLAVLMSNGSARCSIFRVSLDWLWNTTSPFSLTRILWHNVRFQRALTNLVVILQFKSHKPLTEFRSLIYRLRRRSPTHARSQSRWRRQLTIWLPRVNAPVSREKETGFPCIISICHDIPREITRRTARWHLKTLRLFADLKTHCVIFLRHKLNQP